MGGFVTDTGAAPEPSRCKNYNDEPSITV